MGFSSVAQHTDMLCMIESLGFIPRRKKGRKVGGKEKRKEGKRREQRREKRRGEKRKGRGEG